MPSSFVVNLAIFSQIIADLSKADWVACIEELGQFMSRSGRRLRPGSTTVSGWPVMPHAMPVAYWIEDVYNLLAV